MAEAIDAALEANGLTPGDCDWLVPHQANIRIIESMGRRLNLPSDRVVVTVERHANTSAASIPLALAEAVGDGRIQQGDLILMEAMGADSLGDPRSFAGSAAPGAAAAGRYPCQSA